MFESIYPYAIIAVLFSVIWWFFRTNVGKSTYGPVLSFWGSTIVYALTLFLTDFSFYYKLLTMLPRDFIAVVMVVLLANNLKSTRALYFTVVGVGVAGYFLYSNFIPQTIEKYWNQTEEVIVPDSIEELAANGELMIDLKNKNQLSIVQSAINVYGATLTKAFPDLVHEEYSELDDYYLLDIPDDQVKNINQIIKVLYATNAIDWVETNEIIRLSPEENISDSSPSKGIDYGINDPQLDKMWGFEKMQVAEYYNHLRKNKVKPKKKAKGGK